MENEVQILGAIKIKDGLFIGDEFAAQDLEFIVTNKVTHILNCASKEVSNIWESIGVSYLSLTWLESDDQILFDDKNELIEEIFSFIERASINGESCLVHSVRGQSRACCALSAYLMRRFKWSLYKTLEYLNSRRPDLEIRASYFHQLNDLEKRLTIKGLGAISSNWNEIGDQTDMEEIVITNTYINSRNNKISENINNNKNSREIKRKINWVDEIHNTNLIEVFTENEIVNPKKKQNLLVKSIIKGSNKFIRINESSKDDKTHKSPNGFGPYLKMNKSSRSLVDENPIKNEKEEKEQISNIQITNVTRAKPPIAFSKENKENLKNTNRIPKVSIVPSKQGANFTRSSSLKHFKEENINDISSHSEMPQKENITSKPNVIHVTVNNFVNSPNISNNIITQDFGSTNKNPLANSSRTNQFYNEKIITNSSPFNANERKINNFTNNSRNNSHQKREEEASNPFNSKLHSTVKASVREKSPDGKSYGTDIKEVKKKVIIRRPHDSVSPIPVRNDKASYSPNSKHKVMAESIYSKSLLKRFQTSLKEKTYENTYTKILKEQLEKKDGFNNKDISPIRKITDMRKNTNKEKEIIIDEQKLHNSNIINQNNFLSSKNQNINNSSNININNVNYNSNQNAKKIVNPLQNNLNLNNLINSVMSYQVSTKNSLPSQKSIPIRATFSNKDQIINNSNINSNEDPLKNNSKNLSKANIKTQENSQILKPRLRSSSPGNQNSNIQTTINQNYMVNSALINNYCLPNYSYTSKPKWKF